MAVGGGGAAVVSSVSPSLLLVAPPLPLVSIISHFLCSNSFCECDGKHETIHGACTYILCLILQLIGRFCFYALACFSCL